MVSSALINERSGIATAIRFDQSLAKLIETARKAGVTQQPIWRQRIAQLAIQTKIMNASGLRVLSDQLHDRFNPAHLGRHEVHRDGSHPALLRGGGRDAGALGRAARRRRGGDEERRSWPMRFLYDRAMTIAGGTSEIQRNIAAERILGLPRQ